MSFSEFVNEIYTLSLPSAEIQMVLGVVLLIIAIIAILSGIYIIYRLGQLVRKTGFFTNISTAFCQLVILAEAVSSMVNAPIVRVFTCAIKM